MSWQERIASHFFVRQWCTNSNQIEMNLLTFDHYFENLVVCDWEMYGKCTFGSPLMVLDRVFDKCQSLTTIADFEVNTQWNRCNIKSVSKAKHTRRISSLLLHRSLVQPDSSNYLSFQTIVNNPTPQGATCACGHQKYTTIVSWPKKLLVVNIDNQLKNTAKFRFEQEIFMDNSKWELIGRLFSTSQHFTTQISDDNGRCWFHDPNKNDGSMVLLTRPIPEIADLSYLLCYWRQ